ncbi:peptidase domain-containing ABC transporter [Pseudanabaena sp. PCC 6802]|uniref:peptidase domain-containing ABC transporter n=1 Tax=Pseudanabaena sp. PCC 6802 TaxID=118173 RepID=UPI00037D805F|nr:peptidase domain-containing ABC transporter [Pseudanabaena sp. PCC 6802]
MPQLISHTQLQDFLAQTSPFDRLSADVLRTIVSKFQFLQYRMGQTILLHEALPTQITIIYQGQARLLGYGNTNIPISLGVLNPGEILGWISLVRGIPCETAIASIETVVATLPAKDFLELLDKEPTLKQSFQERPALSEVFELVVAELKRRAIATADPKSLAAKIIQEAAILNLPKGKLAASKLDPNLIWLVSSGDIANYPVGSRLNQAETDIVVQSKAARLLGFRDILTDSPDHADTPEDASDRSAEPSIPFAPDRPAAAINEETISGEDMRSYPYVRGRGPADGLLACLQMLSKHMDGSFRRDTLERILENQVAKVGSIPLQLSGALVEIIGLTGQMIQIPKVAINRIKAPALIQWQDSFAVIYKITSTEIAFASPESGGVRRQKIDAFLQQCPEMMPMLLVRPRLRDRTERFGLRSFFPYISMYKGILTQVLIASCFILLFSLANPLITQIIIDKVLVQNSIDTLDILGWLLVGVALFEGLLTALRTYLFVDTTNRIDMSLGSEIIDHMLRLPLSYFDKRRVGELSTRINELENIRSFMTGTALTVVLDAVFSLIYIVVMLFYSVLLTFWALVTVPFFIILAVIASPIIRRQLRVKAERHADTQSYLVEVLSGIQTVKAQNIELKSRWQWQEKYARYVNAGFQTVLTSSWAGSLSGFLNKLSGLILLWVGAHLVLLPQTDASHITLGQLIAFRIIASYVTSPLLRLAQLWQNFQEIGLSIERLSDIIDAEQEVPESDRTNIPMPEIDGAVKFEDVSFRFTTTGPLQLANINVDFPAGSFVGIVGQSGSGKSTLTKLISRLYEPLSGRVQIDGYDINKVELYSLRRQVGTVLQDTLLFNGTVQENIALTNPEATSDDIIHAAKVAAAHDFIMTLPNGYNTVVGERGAGLSGGQRQRIAIARTVLQGPRLLILDEATSALDYDSERQVCNNLAETFHDRTVFFITHRLNTIKNADVIIMMDQGAIVEQGTHEELMQMRGRYYCLYQQQESQT